MCVVSPGRWGSFVQESGAEGRAEGCLLGRGSDSQPHTGRAASKPPQEPSELRFRVGGAAPGEAEEVEEGPVAGAGRVHGALGPAKVAAEGGDLWGGGRGEGGGEGGAEERRARAGEQGRLGWRTSPACVLPRRACHAWFTMLRLVHRAAPASPRAAPASPRRATLRPAAPCCARCAHLRVAVRVLDGVGRGGQHAARAALVLALDRQAEEALLRCGEGEKGGEESGDGGGFGARLAGVR